MPISIQAVRDRLLKQPHGDKAFVDVLLMVKETGLDAMETACERALESGIVNAGIVITELRRLLEPPRVKALTASQGLGLREEPMSDCQRCECLLRNRHVP